MFSNSEKYLEMLIIKLCMNLA